MSDHSWVHIQIVLNTGLRLARLLFRRGVVPSVVADYAMSERDAEVVVATACLMHCVGMSIHREDHERYSLFLAADKLGSLLRDVYEEPERSIIASESLHAIVGHRRKGAPFTIEAGIVRVADALDMARGRSRIPFEAGQHNIHSLSAYAIEDVNISPGPRPRRASRDQPCPTAPGSSRSMSCWPRSCAALGSKSTSRRSHDRGRARAAADPGIPDLMSESPISRIRVAVSRVRVHAGRARFAPTTADVAAGARRCAGRGGSVGRLQPSVAVDRHQRPHGDALGLASPAAAAGRGFGAADLDAPRGTAGPGAQAGVARRGDDVRAASSWPAI